MDKLPPDYNDWFEVTKALIAPILYLGAIFLGFFKLLVMALKKVAIVWKSAMKIVHELEALKKELIQTNKFRESFAAQQEKFNEKVDEDLDKCMIKLREVSHDVRNLMKKEDSVYNTVLSELKEVIQQSQRREDAYVDIFTKKLPDTEKRLSENERKMVIIYKRYDRLENQVAKA